MSKRGLLKGAEALSIIIVVIVASRTFLVKDQGKEVFYAEPVKKQVLREVIVDRRLLAVAPIKEMTIVYEELPGIKNRVILGCLGETAIAIKKRGANDKELQFHLYDNAVKQKLEITIEGMNGSELSEEYIYRVVENHIYQGNPSKEGDLLKSISIVREGQAGDEAGDKTGDEAGDKAGDEAGDEIGKVHIIMQLHTNYAYKLYEDDTYYYISLLRPKDVYDKIIVLDAGHGGIDCGALVEAKGFFEKDINLSILLQLIELVKQEQEIKVYTTRVDDSGLTLNQRVELANNLEADLFLSIHCNSSEDKSIRGLEVLYNEEQDSQEGFRSRDFSELCLAEVSSRIAISNRGIVPRSKSVSIVGKALMPVALLEVAFMSNSSDLDFLLQQENQAQVAKGLYEAIVKSFDELKIEDNSIKNNRK